ncbi:hypothetical protein DSO57_1010214 [Entomophthora muscae]|uniref:Uncharacterized protein n=1 Tax=Entomophthora muscae TaxID=34485 RepID=A0ACC2S8J0_9FUNG|nr:hypothetical protein DSO57_1010214 [Entomophthora muscae]
MKGYLIEESTWEPQSNLVNTKEAVQLYLRKKDLKKGPLGEEGDGVKIDNSPPLENQAQLEVVAPKEELLNFPDGGKESHSVNFMNLKSSQVINQVNLKEENTCFRPNHMTTAQEKDNQVKSLGLLTNEIMLSQGAILPLLYPGVLATRPHIS